MSLNLILIIFDGFWGRLGDCILIVGILVLDVCVIAEAWVAGQSMWKGKGREGEYEIDVGT